MNERSAFRCRLVDPLRALAAAAVLVVTACGGSTEGQTTAGSKSKPVKPADPPIKVGEGKEAQGADPAGVGGDPAEADAAGDIADSGDKGDSVEGDAADAVGDEGADAAGADAAGADAAGADAAGADAADAGDDGKAAGDEGAEPAADPKALLKEVKSKRTKDARAEAALAEAEAAGAEPRDLAKAAKARGDALFASPERAAKFYQWAADKDPKYADPVFGLAKQAAVKGEIDEVKKLLTEVKNRKGKKLLNQIEFDPMWEIVKDDPDVRALLR